MGHDADEKPAESGKDGMSAVCQKNCEKQCNRIQSLCVCTEGE